MENLIVKKLFQLMEDSTTEESSSESDDEELYMFANQVPTVKHVVVRHYIPKIVDKFSDSTFQANYRISRSSVQNLLESIQTDSVSCVGRTRVPLREAILLTIWTLTNNESFRSIGNRFGFSKGHTHKLYTETCKLIADKVDKYIVWPVGSEAINTVKEFNNLRGQLSFPRVFGCINSTHIAIRDPSIPAYVNNMGYNSVILQGICDAQQKFFSIFCGWHGSSSNAVVFNKWPLCEELTEDSTTLIPPKTHLLGDSTYPLQSFLIVPYRDNGFLTKKQKIFNKKLSRTWVLIDRAFRRLKALFNRLNFLYVRKLENIRHIIITACILHNISIDDGTQYEDEESLGDASADYLDYDADDPAAELYRDEIMRCIFGD